MLTWMQSWLYSLVQKEIKSASFQVHNDPQHIYFSLLHIGLIVSEHKVHDNLTTLGAC